MRTLIFSIAVMVMIGGFKVAPDVLGWIAIVWAWLAIFALDGAELKAFGR